MTFMHDPARPCDETCDHPRSTPAEAHPRTYSLVGGGLDMFLVTDDESGINIGYARKIGGPITARLRSPESDEAR